MDIEYHPKCVYDAVKVYSLQAAAGDGSSSVAAAAAAAESGLGARLPLMPDYAFCGSEVPGPVVLHGDAVVEFLSDHIVAKPGFSATVVFTRPLGKFVCRFMFVGSP